MSLDSQYQPGERVRVDDGVRKFKGLVAGANPKNSAEYVINADGGQVWVVHWCHIRRLP